MANWYVRSAATGTGTGADWTNAKTTLAAAFAAGAAGDTFFVSDDHAETQATAMTLTSPGTAASPCLVLCVHHLGSVPPVSADLRTTATITTTGASAITYDGYAYVYGVTPNAGNSASASAGHNFTSAAFGWTLDSCLLKSLQTNANGGVSVGINGGTSSVGYLKLINTPIFFSSASAQVSMNAGTLVWENTASAVQGTAPTTLFRSPGHGGNASCIGVDFSAVGSGHNLVDMTGKHCDYYFQDCELGASVTLATGAASGQGGVRLEVVNCDSGNTNYRYFRQDSQGSIQQETTIIRTNGATDGTTGVSRKMISTASAKWHAPLSSQWVLYWDDSPGSKTIAIPVITDGVTLTNADAWIECNYLGTTALPLGKFANDATADALASGTNQPTDTSTWTTTGLTSPVKQLLSATFTTTLKGLVRARVRLAKPSTTLYFDPLILASSGRQFMLGASGYMNEAVQSGGSSGGPVGVMVVPQQGCFPSY